jgi:hypothetical protein
MIQREKEKETILDIDDELTYYNRHTIVARVHSNNNMR